MLHAHEQKKCTFNCASYVCDRQQIELDCVANASGDALYRTHSCRTGVFFSHAVAIKLAMYVGLVGGKCGTGKLVMFVIIRSCALGIYDLSKFLGGRSQN